MNFDEYQEAAVKTAVYPEQHSIVYPIIGAANEAGEVLGKVKKWMRGDDGEGEMSEERKRAIAFELGDVLWYLAAAARDLGFDLNDIASANIDKLYARQEAGTIHGDGDYR